MPGRLSAAADDDWQTPRGKGGGDWPLVRPTAGETWRSRMIPASPGLCRTWSGLAALLAGSAILLLGLGACLSALDAPNPVHIAQPDDGVLIRLDTMQATRTTTLAGHPHRSRRKIAAPERGESAYSSYQDLLGGYSRHWAAGAPRGSERAPTVQALASRKRLQASSGESLAEGAATGGSEPSGSAEIDEPSTDFARSCRGIGLDSWMSWAAEGQDQDEATCPTQSSSTLCRTRSASTFCGQSWRPLKEAKHTVFPAQDGSCAVTEKETNPWWRVAFGREVDVSSVIIFGRTCHQKNPDKLAACRASLAGFNVRVGNDFTSGMPRPTEPTTPLCPILCMKEPCNPHKRALDYP